VRPALQPHGALARGAFAVAVLVSLAVLFAPPADVPTAPPGVDKLVHGTVFVALAVTGRWAGAGRTVLAVVLGVYAVASEIVQGLIGRDAAWGDVVADLVGLVVGLVVWHWSSGTSRRAGRRPRDVLRRRRPPGSLAG
jgi:VanZ family protein